MHQFSVWQYNRHLRELCGVGVGVGVWVSGGVGEGGGGETETSGPVRRLTSRGTPIRAEKVDL